MTQRKQPAAATEAPKQPEAPRPTARELRMAEVERKYKAFEEAGALFADISSQGFYLLLTFKQIIDRDCGSTTPVEEFLSHLIWLYGNCDEEGFV